MVPDGMSRGRKIRERGNRYREVPGPNEPDLSALGTFALASDESILRSGVRFRG